MPLAHGKLLELELALLWLILCTHYFISKVSKKNLIVVLTCQQNYSNTLIWASKYSIEWELFLLFCEKSTSSHQHSIRL